MTPINGHTLISWGFQPGAGFRSMIQIANAMRTKSAHVTDEEIILRLREVEGTYSLPQRLTMRDEPRSVSSFLPFVGSPEMKTNEEEVMKHMNFISRMPGYLEGAVMPDACPAGSQLGTIPVGGVVAMDNVIVPGMHSADICCSVAATNIDGDFDLKEVLNAAQRVTHFGFGGRDDTLKTKSPFYETMESMLLPVFKENPFLKGLEDVARWHFMTQGDGNHFFFVGESKATGIPTIVTHHGSRGLGAQLYNRGMAAAVRETRTLADVPSHLSFLPADTEIGQQYWAALQIVRAWTRSNHLALHRAVLDVLRAKFITWHWNEHNFVFRDGTTYYHAKGATPVSMNLLTSDPEHSAYSLIPRNMASSILVVANDGRTVNRKTMGFAPHGAGRHMSRKAYMASVDDPKAQYAKDTAGVDVRWFSGVADLTECASAYKDAEAIRKAIDYYGLANVVDEIEPYGTIMAGQQILRGASSA